VGAIPDIIKDFENGFVIQAGDYKALAEKIVTLARNSSLRQDIARNNVEKIKQHYDKKVIFQKLQKEYDKLLENQIVN
jgi:glycosyltransferase involved in cell wall biosynthesis